VLARLSKAGQAKKKRLVINMAPRRGLGHDSPSSFHASKGPSIAPPETQEEAEKVKKTLPKVVALDAKTCTTSTVDEVVEAMKVAGGLIIRNAVHWTHWTHWT